jgi:hypothetical protein
MNKKKNKYGCFILWFFHASGVSQDSSVRKSRTGLDFSLRRFHPGVLFLEVKWSERDAGHSLPSGAEVKNSWTFTSAVPVSFRVRCLVINTALPLPCQ